MVNVHKDLMSMFADSGFTSGAEFYVRAASASAYLHACADLDLVIIGIELFEVTGDKLKPRLDLIADFSTVLTSGLDWGEAVNTGHREALQFVEAELKIDSNMVMTVAIVEQ